VIVCIAANPSMDKLFEVDCLQPGRIHRPRRFLQVPGGKALNVARAALSLGCDVLVVALLAGHSGRWLQESLRLAAIPTRASWAAGETRSSLSVAEPGGSELTEFYESGTGISRAEWRSFSQLVEASIPGAEWVVFSGSIPQGAPAGGYAPIISTAQRLGVRVALDSRGTALESAMGAGPDLVKVNLEEAAGFLTPPPGDLAEAAERLLIALGKGDHRAVVTSGTEGAVLASTSGTIVRATLDVVGQYPVGSGDAFMAGLVGAASTPPGRPVGPEDLSLAMGAAAANAEQPGAGCLDPERARFLAGNVVLKNLA
jgi:1-phosphofructokinase family hexose kinase